MIISKVTENQGFTLSLKDALLVETVYTQWRSCAANSLLFHVF